MAVLLYLSDSRLELVAEVANPSLAAAFKRGVESAFSQHDAPIVVLERMRG